MGSADGLVRGALRLALRLEVGGLATIRNLDFQTRANFDEAPAGYSGPPTPGVHVAAEVYPIAFGSSGFFSGLGFAAEYNRSVLLTTHHRAVAAALAYWQAVSSQSVPLELAESDNPLGRLSERQRETAMMLADGLTVAGVPLWWPFRRRRSVFLGVLAFRTRSWAEALVVLGVVAGVGWWVAA